MRVAIIGAGFTGLTAAYELSKKGYTITVFEKNSFAGGLASGIKNAVNDYPVDWEWDLERFYHHWFTNDKAIFNLIKELGAEDKLIVKWPITASWYQDRFWQLDSPLSLLKFSPLSPLDRLRTGLALGYLKYLVKPDQTQKLEQVTAAAWLQEKMGSKTYETVWQPLLRGKFKEYYDQVNLTWFWARIYKRTPRLAYFEGGFGNLVDLLVEAIKKQGGKVQFEVSIQKVVPTTQGLNLRDFKNLGDLEMFDKIIVTTPPPTLAKLIPQLPKDYQSKLTAQTDLGALCLILSLDQPFLDKVYWLNMTERNWPFLAVVEHTNFVNPKYYGGKHIVYIGNYLPVDHPQMKMDKEELLNLFLPYLKKINSNFQPPRPRRGFGEGGPTSNFWLFKEPFAQPIVGFDHSQKILPFKTPLPGVYLASMSQVYPWDRGTNYAVELGQKVTQEVLKDNV